MTQIQNTSWSFAAPKYFRVAAREHTLAPPGRHRARHSRMSLTSCQSRPAIDAAIYRPNGTLHQLQSSFHPQSTQPEPTARARLGFPRELWIENLGGSWYSSAHCQAPVLICIRWKPPCVVSDGSRRACGVGDCTRLLPTLSDLREASGPRIDRIPQRQPPHYTANPTRAPAVQKWLSKRSPWTCPHPTPSARHHSRKSNSLRRPPPKRHRLGAVSRSRGSPVRSCPSCATRAALAAR